MKYQLLMGKITRRSVLATIGASGTAAIGIPNTGAATVVKSDDDDNDEDSEGRTVFELTGLVSQYHVRTLHDSEAKVEAVAGELERKGWKAAESSGRHGFVSVPKGNDYYFGVIPFESNGTADAQAAILWKRYEFGRWDVTGYILADGKRNSRAGHVLRATDSTANSTAPAVSVSEFGGGETANDGCICLDPGPGGGDEDCVYFHDEYCDDFNLSCILWLIAQVGVGCGFAGPIGCLAGAGVSLAPYLTDDGCEVCNEYAEEGTVLC